MRSLDDPLLLRVHLDLEVRVTSLHEVSHDAEDSDPAFLDIGAVLQLGREVAEGAGDEEGAQGPQLVVLKIQSLF